MSLRTTIKAVAVIVMALSSTVAMSSSSHGGSVITASDVGWYDQLGEHITYAKSFMVGYAGDFDGNTYRSYYTFNLAGITQTISSATIQIYDDPYGYQSPNSQETLRLYDVTTSSSQLSAPQFNATSIYNDLGSGNVYASSTVYAPTDPSVGRWVSVNMNMIGLAALNKARGSVFSVGSSLASLSPSLLGTWVNQVLFASGYSASEVQLVLNFSPTVTGASAVTPEPSTFVGAALAAGMGALMFRLRRRSR